MTPSVYSRWILLTTLMVLSANIGGCREESLPNKWRANPDDRIALLPQVREWLKVRDPVSIEEFLRIFGPTQGREPPSGSDSEYEILYHAGTYAANGYVPMDNRWIAFKVKDGRIRGARVL